MYAPEIITQPKIWDCLGGQIDVFPTAMNVLKLPYSNNTLGVDLLAERRPFIYFSAAEKFGVISDSLLLIVTQGDDTEGLFRYRHGDKTNYINHYRTIANEMKNYAIANMQTAQYMLIQRKQGAE
jgi:phosphoglycerol transferase MdoB-like AlkP superfamily enzyme